MLKFFLPKNIRFCRKKHKVLRKKKAILAAQMIRSLSCYNKTPINKIMFFIDTIKKETLTVNKIWFDEGG